MEFFLPENNVIFSKAELNREFKPFYNDYQMRQNVELIQSVQSVLSQFKNDHILIRIKKR